MPSDSIAGFLDRAQASRVLFPEQVEQLIRQPDIPQTDLTSLCSYLLSRGVLTQFQADAIRDGHGADLNFAGYPVIDALGPFPGGTAYRALHPALRTPLVLRRYGASAFEPTDSAAAVGHRARTFGTIQHPNLLTLLDAGELQGEAYAVHEQPADAADLGALLKEVGGAMPAFLAAEYGWAVASALRAVHERGGWHGDVCPERLLVGPVLTKTKGDGTRKRRPAPNATVRLTDTGLIPLRPPASAAPPAPDALAYVPPERVDGTSTDARGDIYGLGAVLYTLLAGRAPFAGASADEVLGKVRTTEPPALAVLRPTEPPELTALVTRMLAKRPEDRPQTAAEVCAALAPLCRPGTVPLAAAPTVVPTALPVSSMPRAVPVAHAVPTASVAEELPPEAPEEWGVESNAFAAAQDASTADKKQVRRRGMTDAEKARSRMWMIVGLCLHLTAVGLIIAWAMGAFSSSPPPKDDPDTRKPDPTIKKKGKKQPNPDS
jgi:hypothetical protein